MLKEIFDMQEKQEFTNAENASRAYDAEMVQEQEQEQQQEEEKEKAKQSENAYGSNLKNVKAWPIDGLSNKYRMIGRYFYPLKVFSTTSKAPKLPFNDSLLVSENQTPLF